MAFNKFNVITERGVSAKFKEAMSKAPNVYLNHVEVITSDSEDEKQVWLGAVPRPREHLGNRLLQQFNEFSQTIVNQAFETSFLVHRDSFADDKIGAIQSRIAEVAESHAHFKDDQFAALLEAADTDVAFDGTSFYDATREINDSGVIDNTGTVAATGGANNPSVSEVLLAIKEAIQQMSRFADDKGRIGFNGTAMNTLRVVIPPEYRRSFAEAINSTIVIDATDAAGVSNPWGNGLVQFDELPWLTDADNSFYLNAVAATRKPFYFQEREKLEVIVDNDASSVANNNGVKVLVRERFRFAYGDPRRSFKFIFTT